MRLFTNSGYLVSFHLKRSLWLTWFILKEILTLWKVGHFFILMRNTIVFNKRESDKVISQLCSSRLSKRTRKLFCFFYFPHVLWAMTDLFWNCEGRKTELKKHEVVCLFCPFMGYILQGLSKLWTPAVHHEILAGSIGVKLWEMFFWLL